MTVKVYRPAIEVALFRMVARRDGRAERYSGAARKIDLTPYLGDNSSIKTLKGLYEAAGGFTITFPDQPYPETLDTIEAMIEPMDLIEIRAAREPWRYTGQPLPLIMRGWVTDVERPRGIGQEGTPQRSVVVMGQDAGKLFLINQVFYEIAYLQEVPFLDFFRMQAETGMDVAMLPVSEFITQLTERVVNRKVREMAGFSQQIVREFRVDATVHEGIAAANVAANVQGTMWQIAELFADRPWNELFIEDEDEEEGPVVRFRPNPFKDVEGRLIMRGAADPSAVEVDSEAIEHIRMRRSDRQVANFFSVPPGPSMESGGFVNVHSLQQGEPLDDEHGNNDPELYGRRRMRQATRLLPSDLSTLPVMMPEEADRRAGARDITFWHLDRAKRLKEMNRDNVVFEDGHARLRGSEELKIGRYLRVTEGDATWEAYMTRVSHTFAPLQTWKTEVTLDRGTGFLERTKRTTSSFFAETANGPYR
ncbi:hypothetical protein EJV46_05880 [Roseococcus sp. SYP-B2431]|uniref:hypothetical protein n=1 Tax=Roseococcus sp. SYP-B2431 TaxID=2496640 RepID=UPI00103AC92A|nr:hypothetical protein [Roseococcus sp. SYP-B2431]TCI00179.1 hypothetical protein EJV46_05880 [Roseococcus sp. SYP-B2431]